MQIHDDRLPNVYACGDVAECALRNTNSRTAMKQADVVADNIALALEGKSPSVLYKPHWGDALIKLTLGLVSRFSCCGITRANIHGQQEKAITHFSDGTTEMLFKSSDREPTLHVQRVWAHLGFPGFEDADYEKQKAEVAV